MIPALARFLHLAAEGTRKIRRRTQYDEVPENERTRVETHLLQTAWLAAAMIAIERAHGEPAFDPVRVLTATVLHDIAESRIGDVHYDVKADPRISAILREIEKEYAHKMFSRLPDQVRAAFTDAYAVEDERGKTADGDFFNAVERLGYVYDTLQWIIDGKKTLRKVYDNQHEPLVKLMDRFVSVRLLYEPIRSFVEQQLQEYRHEQKMQSIEDM